MSNNEYDTIGELFRRKLENHRIPVNGNIWDKIERSLNKPKNKTVIWLWRSAIMAAAATIAALLVLNHMIPEENTLQQTVAEESVKVNSETSPTAVVPETIEITQADIIKPVYKSVDSGNNETVAVFQTPDVDYQTYEVELASVTQLKSDETKNQEIAVAEQEEILITEIEQKPEIPKLLDILLAKDTPKAKKEKKWLLAAALSTGNNNLESFNSDPVKLSQSVSSRGYSNEYAVNLSDNIVPFKGMVKNDFKNIKHLPPLSFGVMVRSLGKRTGIESGLVYTYLSSRFEWSVLSTSYNVHQNLHYLGIPVNMLVYLWNSNPNWQVYFSGGFMVEKGLRAIYNQEMRTISQIRNTMINKSSIDGVQLSVNGAFGANYRLYKSWGIYFEPRIGYSFDCNQPISIRTEWPVYFGFNLGLNYEL